MKFREIPLTAPLNNILAAAHLRWGHPGLYPRVAAPPRDLGRRPRARGLAADLVRRAGGQGLPHTQQPDGGRPD